MPGRPSKVSIAGGTPATCMDLLGNLLKAEAQKPSIQQVYELEKAFQALLSSQDGEGSATTQVVQKTSKVATAVCKYAGQQLVPGLELAVMASLTGMIQAGMQWLLSQTQQDGHGRRPLLQLLYHCAKRVLLPGQVSHSMHLGWLLHDSFTSTKIIIGQEDRELYLAAVLHLMVCVSDLKLGPQMNPEQYQHDVMKTAAVVPPAVEYLRANSGHDTAKQLEGIFKCLYKMILNIAKQLPAQHLNTPVVADLIGLLSSVAVDVKQNANLPQYITRLASDVKGDSTTSIVMGVFEACSRIDTGDACCPQMACVDAAMNIIWNQPQGIEMLLKSPRWLACCECCSMLAIHWQALQLHLATLTCGDEEQLNINTGVSMQGHVHQSAQLLCQLTAPAVDVYVTSTAVSLSSSTKGTRSKGADSTAIGVNNSNKNQTMDAGSVASSMLLVAWSGLQYMSQAISPLTTDAAQAAHLLRMGSMAATGQILQSGVQLAVHIASQAKTIGNDREDNILCKLGSDRGSVLQVGLSLAAAALRLSVSWLLVAQDQESNVHTTSAGIREGPCHAGQQDQTQCKDQGTCYKQQGGGGVMLLSSAASTCQALLQCYDSQDGCEDIEWLVAIAAALGKELAASGLTKQAAQLQQLVWAGCKLGAHKLAEDAGGMLPCGEVAGVERRGRACTSALLRADMFNEAAAAAAECVTLLSMGGASGILLTPKLIQQHVHARLHAMSAVAAVDAAAVTHAVALPAADSASQPAGATRRKGRLKGMKAAAQPAPQPAADPVAAQHASTPMLLIQQFVEAERSLGSGKAQDWLVVLAYEEALQYQKAPTKLQAPTSSFDRSFLQQAAAQAVADIARYTMAATAGDACQHACAQLLAHLLKVNTNIEPSVVHTSSSCSPDLLSAADILASACDRVHDTSSHGMDVDGQGHAGDNTLQQVLLCSAAATACSEAALDLFKTAVTASANTSSPSTSTTATATVEGGGVDNDDPCVPLSAASTATAVSEWQQHVKYRQSAVQHWQRLVLALDSQEPARLRMIMLPKLEVCMQLVLQLWQICHLHDDASGMQCLETAAQAHSRHTSKSSSAAAAIATVMRQATGTAAWALSPCLQTPSLVECLGWEGSCPEDVQQLLQTFLKARCLRHGAAPDYVQQACKVAAARSQPQSQPTQAAQLLHVQLLQLCTCTLLQCGRTAEAWGTSQDALRMSSLLYHRPHSAASSSRQADGTATGMASPANHHPQDCTTSLHEADHVDDVQQASDQAAGDACTGADTGLTQTTEQVQQQQRQQSGHQSQFVWLCASAYMCSLLQAAEVNEILGMVDEAMCLLQECSQLANRLGAAAVAGLAIQRTAIILKGQSQQEAASAMVRPVQCAGEHTNYGVYQLLSANHAQIQAVLQPSCAQHLWQQSQQHLRQLQQGCEQSCSALQLDGMRLECACHAAAVEEHLRCLNSAAAAAELQAAEASLQRAVAAMQRTAAGCMMQVDAKEGDSQKERSMQAGQDAMLDRVVWPELQVQLLLLKHEVETVMKQQQQQQACIHEQDAGTSKCSAPSLAAVAGLLLSHKPASTALPSLEEQLAQSCTISDPPPKPAARQKAGGSTRAGRAGSQRTAKPTPGTSVAASAAGAAAAANKEPAASSGVQLVRLLQAFVLSWSYPATFVKTCQHLLLLCVSAGLPHAACMFLHLSIGAATNQQLLAKSLHAATMHSSKEGSQHCSEAQDSTIPSDQQCPTLQRTLHNARQCIATLLQSIASNPGITANAHAVATHRKPPGLQYELETAATGWLTSHVPSLPSPCTLACISSTPFPSMHAPLLIADNVPAAAQTKWLAVSRFQPGCVPLVLLLQTGNSAQHCEGHVMPQVGSSGSDSSSNQPQAKTARASKLCSDPAGLTASKHNQEAVTGSEPYGTASRLQDAAQPLLDQLQAVLEASSSSMVASADLNTADGKAAWWKERLLLDTHMSQLLHSMQRDWLGTWGCLALMQQPVHPEQQQRVAEAAKQLAAQHLANVSPGSTGYLVVTCMVQLLLTQAIHMSDVELQEAVKQLVDMVADRTRGCDCDTAAGLTAGVKQCAASMQAPVTSAAYDTVVPQAVAVGSCGNATSSQGGHRASHGMESDAELSRREVLPAVPSVQHLGGRRGVGGSSSRLENLAATAPCQTGDSKAEPAARRKASRLKTLIPSSSQDKAKGQPASVRQDAARDRQQAAAGIHRSSRTSRSRAPIATTPLATHPEPVPTRTLAKQHSKSQPVQVNASEQELEAAPSKHAEQPPTLMAGNNIAPPQPTPLLLVLSSSLHALPWESMPCMRTNRAPQVYRVPSLLFAAAMAAHLASVGQATAVPISSSGSSSSSSSSSSIATVAVPKRRRGAKPEASGSTIQGAAGHAAADQSHSMAGKGLQEHQELYVDLSSTYYLINPAGDLQDTQACFERWFAEELGWQGTAGHSPPSRQLLAALQSHALFVYFGHGSGEQYLPATGMRGVQRLCAKLLMGCSSGRLKTQGMYPPTGPLLTYLMAGCPAIVANLWDVTDKDIDRFSKTALQHWLQAGHDSNTHADGQEAGDEAGQSSDVRARLGGAASAAGRSMSGAVAASRAACKLQNLIGAAPVCYGLPMQVAWPKHQ